MGSVKLAIDVLHFRWLLQSQLRFELLVCCAAQPSIRFPGDPCREEHTGTPVFDKMDNSYQTELLKHTAQCTDEAICLYSYGNV